MTNTNGNAKYSSDVFSMLLQDKNRALEIYSDLYCRHASEACVFPEERLIWKNTFENTCAAFCCIL